MKRHGSVRIIGGKWRGRKLLVPDVVGLRPTHDRIRETLFNWLQLYIKDDVCLDLFAGSGEIGFEALSRGAKHVVMLDNNREVVRALSDSAQHLSTGDCEIIHADFPKRMPEFKQRFDIVFVDPPYKKGLIEPVCEWLDSSNVLQPDALIYIETEIELDPLPIPQGWEIFKEGKTATLRYCLVRKNAS